MHDILLALHNILRWVVVILSVVVLFRAYRGWLAKKAWEKTDRMLGMVFTSTFDTQILLGLLLYFFSSDYGLNAFLTHSMGEVLADATYRLFAILHPLVMILAVVCAHLGSMLPKKARDDVTRHQRAAIFFSLTLLLVLIAIPWGRPLFPGL